MRQCRALVDEHANRPTTDAMGGADVADVNRRLWEAWVRPSSMCDPRVDGSLGSWANQSQNALVNYHNRNASSSS